MRPRPSDLPVRSIVVGAALLATGSCGTAAPAHDCGGFSLSLVSDRGGQPSPVAAAEWFSEHGGVPGVPSSGWHQDGSGSSVRSGELTLHVVQGPDATWQVDSGSYC
jgi:hypothetical protein